MAKKKTKGRATKTVARKKGAKAATRKTTAKKAAKKSGKTAPETTPAKATVPARGFAPATTMDLLRSWSSSRYSTR